MNISSIVVKVNKKDTKELSQYFKNCDFCDYHFSDETTGKIIITIEGEGVDEEIKKIKKISQTPKVISADMMMSYSEDELEKEREKIEISGCVPSVLDEDLDAKQIDYYGNVINKI